MPSTSFSWAHHRGRVEIRTGHTKGPSWWADVPMLRLRDNKTCYITRYSANIFSPNNPRQTRTHGAMEEPGGSACALSRLGSGADGAVSAVELGNTSLASKNYAITLIISVNSQN